MKCTSCGAEIDVDRRQCLYCGSKNPTWAAVPPAVSDPPPASSDQAFPRYVQVVNNLTQVYHDDSTYTNVCPNAEMSNCNRLVALLLCFFGGFLGLHRFYVGKNVTGLLYLCTAGFFGMGWMLDLLLLFFGRFTDRCGYRLL